ncbi:Yip1 family protein [Saccharibacillus sacchari]|uniref:Formate hydrogenlyase subunit 3/multisubunit Na+/H+ antiporter, MnhD subunit n=1 Tax=Saccharibacillus sacchari DSM 19268 TaxID=915437 RepID=A0A011AMJ1_9BACL|nr:Yip1 family protein [Saccharibacillus sacchari]EXG83191.1 formate hydrogenlyase subunit 3/multisubunit Na+/H+ antiporter, MnhD subunit [Saccharibacillus sacchari DSM 19268]
MDGRRGNDGNEGSRNSAGQKEGGLFGRDESQNRNSQPGAQSAYGQGSYYEESNEEDLYGRQPDDSYDGSRQEQRGGQPEEDRSLGGLSPWLRVWIHPRQVTRDFMRSSDPLRGALLLALIAGVFNALNTASTRNSGDTMTASGLAVSVLLGGVIGGLATYYIGAWLMKLVGGWLGGVGSTQDMRIVSGRISGMLAIMVGLFWIPELLIAGMENFTYSTPNLDASMLRTLLYLLFVLLESGFGIWSFVAVLHAAGEAHRFSAWKALLMFVILGVCVFFLAFIVILVVALMFGAAFGAFGL